MSQDRDQDPPPAVATDAAAQARLDAVLAENRSLRQLLQAAQSFGRLSLWERDSATDRADWGPHLRQVFGLPPEREVPSLAAAMEQVDPADREPVERAYRHARGRPGTHEVRFRVRRADGGRAWLHSIWCAPEHGTRLMGLIIDDTETMARAEQHEMARKQLAMLSRIIGLFLWRRDFVSGRFYLGEDVWLPPGDAPEDAGLTRDEFAALVHPDDHPYEIRPEDADALGDQLVTAEIRFRDPGQPFKTMLTRRVVQRDASDEPIGILGVGVDVTEQVQERERHRLLLARFDLLVETTGVGVWTWDLETGAQQWNEAMRDIYGLGPGDALPDADIGSDGVSHAVLAEDRERVALGLRNAGDPGAQRTDVRFRIRRPDGQIRILTGRAQRMDGARRTLCGIVLDVTESHQAEQALREKELAERADQAKSAFLSRVSHELRTPLNAVLGFGELLLADADDPLSQAQRQRLHQVQQAGRHLLGLVDDLLDIGREGALPPAVAAGAGCELGRIVEQVLAWQGPVADAAGISLGLTGQAPAVVGGERYWRQVVANLVSNAIKFNRRGGFVELELSQAGTPPWPLLTVRDNGRGLSDEQQQHLFEPFNRLGAERDGIPGTGLGLSIVRQLVQAMGGEVEVHSDPGQGTSVRVRVPPARTPDGHGGLAAPAPGPTAAPEAAAADLVYVEDNAVNVMLVAEILRQRPQVRLHVAGTVAEALPLIRRLRPVLLLADMHLPDGDGLGMLRELHAGGDRPARHCVVLSADAMPDEVARARAGGFDDYWPKPIDLKAFLDGVDRLLGAG